MRRHLASSTLSLAVLAALMLAWLASCAAPSAQVQSPANADKTVQSTQAALSGASEATSVPAPAQTEAPAAAVSSPPPTATPPPQPTQAQGASQEANQATQPASPTPAAEGRIVELEYPPRLRLGDSDVIRLSLIPSLDGYTVRTEFPDHRSDVQDVQVPQISGYDLFAIARLEGVAFTISPTGEQALLLAPGKEATWYWSLQPLQGGQQRLAVRLLLRWQPQAGTAAPLHENLVFSRGIQVQVASFFGLNRAQSLSGGLFGLFLGAALFLWGWVYQPGLARAVLTFGEPNPSLSIEPPAGLRLAGEEAALLRTLFRRYARLVLESEFLSGYSGARTFLAQPLQPDGRADAHTIIKIGEAQAMSQEFGNYERYVKNTLPPVTARIQQPPVSVRGSRLAAIQYTFIGTPKEPPLSLRQALLARPDPDLLHRLFETFGPNWWMQRRPYTFRLALEYDRVLPTYLVVAPAGGRGQALDGRSAPGALDLKTGDLVSLHNFPVIERRADGQSLSLLGVAQPGEPPLRVRWLGLQNPNGAVGRVVAARSDLLQGWVKGFDLFGLPEPLQALPAALKTPVMGSQSTIHGDLNLENVLVGPGGFVWLIDFAMTRDGHTLFDFAHLGASLVAQVIAPQISTPAGYLRLLDLRPFDGPPARLDGDPLAGLLAGLTQVAGQCLANPTQPREFHLALYAACLGALKYTNLQPFQKHLLYLTAAHLSQEGLTGLLPQA